VGLLHRPVRAAIGAASLLLASAALAGCGGASVTQIVADSIEQTGRIKTFHFALDIRNQPKSTSGLQLSAAEGDIMVPDRLRADVTGTFAGIPISTQLVVVGDDTFLKDPLSGAWRKVDVNTSPIPFFDPAEGILAVMRGAQDLEEDGSEDVGGADTVRLDGRVAVSELTPLLGNEPSDESAAVTFWIGKEDSILRRVRVNGPISPKEPDDIYRVVEVSRFDEPVTIEPPEGAG
jgi:hypothetical protein